MIKTIGRRKVFVFKLILFFIAISSYAQQKSGIKGIVFLVDVPLQNVNVKNLSSNEIIVTDEKGQFIINATSGDTLLFSSIQLVDLKLVLFKKDIDLSKIEVLMTEKITNLKEVMIDKNSNINAFSLGIIPKKIKKTTHAERKLKTAGDFKPIHLLSLLGGALDIDPIVNAINGRTKKIKQEIEIEKKESDLTFLKNHFYNYFNKDLKLSDSMIKNIFFYAIEDKNFQILVKNKDNEKIKFFLLEYANTLKVKQ